MAKRKIELVNEEIYHIVIKAVEGLKLFRDKNDYLRMIHDLFEFNDIEQAPSFFRTKQYRSKTSVNVTKQGFVTLVTLVLIRFLVFF